MTTQLSAPTATGRSRVGRKLAAALLVALISTSCSGSEADSTDARPGRPSGDVEVEMRPHIGPRAVDVDREMMLVVDSIQFADEDILVRVRVVNLSGEEWLDLGADATRYGPLIVLRDDLGNTYPALAVEPAGVYDRSIGRLDLRLDGRLYRGATELTFELASQRGRLATDPIPAPTGSAVRWWSEAPSVSFSDLTVRGRGGRTIQVLDVVDRGTHIEVSIRGSDRASGFAVPDDLDATLTLADDTELRSLQHDGTDAGRHDVVNAVLRFPGALPTEAALVLDVAGLAVEIPAARPPSSAAEPPFADLPQLPDLIHAKIFNDPLPASTVIVEDLDGTAGY